MSTQNFFKTLTAEVARLDEAKIAKRHELIIDGFVFADSAAPQAIIQGKPYRLFNSNDYLGLRHHPIVKSGEAVAAEKFGAGPGAVRFISGSLAVHRKLEQAIAQFHQREAGMVFSSAFATNLAVLFSLIKGQSKDALISDKVLVLSDELNHRSIIEGIRVANLPSEQRAVFKHMDMRDLERVLTENQGKFDRVVLVTDGVFSMLGEFQDLAAVREVTAKFDAVYPNGVLLVVDDCHGVGACGVTGRGVEEVTGAQADVLVGTFGKAFGADGGYVVGSQVLIDYLRESCATYIYSNSISPGTAGAALAAVQLLDQPAGVTLLEQSRHNVAEFQALMSQAGFSFAAQSNHPIQPVLVGDPAQTKQLKEKLFAAGMVITSINYPVVPKGRDEIRVQISAAHTTSDLTAFVAALTQAGKELGLIN
jgi:glycine C-acetyltransferase